MRKKNWKWIALSCIITILLTSLAGCAETPEESQGSSAESAIVVKEQTLMDALTQAAQIKVDNANKQILTGGRLHDLKEEVAFPSTFDLRKVDTDGDGVTENYVTSIKYQNPFGTCWAFGAIAAAETSILYELGTEAVIVQEDGTKKDAIDLSEHHLGWFTYTPLPEGDEQAGEGLYSQADDVDKNLSQRLNSGSTSFAATAMFASGMGPVQEPDFETAQAPESQLNYHGANMEKEMNSTKSAWAYSANDDWSVDESQRFRQTYMLEDAYFLASPISYLNDGKYDVTYADLVCDSYKEQLMNGRAIAVAFHADNYNPLKENRAAQYINVETWAHYCYENTVANHVVCIIGWDDNYPKENFLTEVQEKDSDGNLLFNEDGSKKMKTVSQPPKDGAWIVKNSWGALDSYAPGLNQNAWGVDGNGYFYLSYYDQSIDSPECFDFDVTNELKQELGEYSLEEYDLMPSEFPAAVRTQFPVATANSFIAEEDEIIKAISCTTTVCNEEVTFTLYQYDGEEPLPDNTKMLGTYTQIYEFAGLHVFMLPEYFTVNKGSHIAVVLTQKVEEEYLFSVGTEFNQKGYEEGLCADKYAAKAVIHPGESYVYFPDEDKWLDFADVKKELEEADGPTSYLAYDNFPIKIYASLKE